MKEMPPQARTGLMESTDADGNMISENYFLCYLCDKPIYRVKDYLEGDIVLNRKNSGRLKCLECKGEGDTTLSDVSCLPADDPGALRLGWVIYEEIHPIANDWSIFYPDATEEQKAQLFGKETRWMDGSNDKLELRNKIIDRVSDLMKGMDRTKNRQDLLMDLCFICRDQCETEEDIAAWELPKEEIVKRESTNLNIEVI